MSRQAHHHDFAVTVPGVGTFTFGRRAFGDQLKIAAEYARLSEGQPLAQVDAEFANMVADVRVLTVKSPEGWSIDALDPVEGYEIMQKVWSALRDKEIAFRSKPKASVEGAGEGTIEVD